MHNSDFSKQSETWGKNPALTRSSGTALGTEHCGPFPGAAGLQSAGHHLCLKLGESCLRVRTAWRDPGCALLAEELRMGVLVRVCGSRSSGMGDRSSAVPPAASSDLPKGNHEAHRVGYALLAHFGVIHLLRVQS